MGRLLVVDDDPDFGELVRVVGIKLGFEVEVANSGDAFMRLYESFKPSVVMLDVVMPDIGGIELIRWLGARDSDASVIVVTGYSYRYGELGMKLAKANGLRSVSTLTKPIRLSNMRAALVQTVED